MECEPNHCGQIGTFDKTSAGSDDFCYVSLRKTKNGLNWEKLEKCMYKQHVDDSKSSYQMNLVHSFAHINMQTSISPGANQSTFYFSYRWDVWRNSTVHYSIVSTISKL